MSRKDGAFNMWRLYGGLMGAMIRGDTPEILPFCQTTQPLQARELLHSRLFSLHCAFHPKNSKDFADILAFIFTVPPGNQVGANVIFLLQAGEPKQVNRSFVSPVKQESQKGGLHVLATQKKPGWRTFRVELCLPVQEESC